MEESEKELKCSAIVLEHAENPRNVGPLRTCNGHAVITGPCGDTMEFWLLVSEGRVEKVSFITNGCGYSRACGSIACVLAEGVEVRKAAGILREDILGALGGLPSEVEHCALLASDTLRAACEDYMHTRGESRPKGAAGGEDRRGIAARLAGIGKTIMVLSGKGGVGKSTVAVNLAAGMALDGLRVGLLDLDIHGPSVPTMLGVQRASVQSDDGEILPLEIGGLKVMSMGFFLENREDAVIWRGPMKMNAIRQFIADVAWGELDWLVLDLPPGTGDEALSICQVLEKVDGALVVTTPQEVAAADVRRSITFCRQLGVRVLGVVENMSGFVCPDCGKVTPIFREGGGSRISEEMGVPFLGAIPIDPRVAESGDSGRAFICAGLSSSAATMMSEIIRTIKNTDC